ncbi:MAG TPA: agmatinase [Thermodesulfovibrionales bacterium]|nr:agmatinase [Thermodesulfovibrionales bacterium]
MTLLPPRNFLNLPEEWSGLDRSRVVILPVPYEHTTSYGKGTASGPVSVLAASGQVELYDEELGAEIYRVTGGIATLEPMEFQSFDATALGLIEEQVHGLIEKGKTVVCIGGEHSISIGAVHAHSRRYANLSVLQLDAHSDLRDEYEGDRYSHACVMARVYDFNKDIVQVGIRSQCAAEAEFIKREGIKTFYDYSIRQREYGGGGRSWDEEVIDFLKGDVYLTFDCDFFDPALMPAVGTPEPGGFGWYETLSFLRRLAKRRNIVGFDITELSPLPGLIHPQFIIAKLIYKLIGYISSR